MIQELEGCGAALSCSKNMNKDNTSWHRFGMLWPYIESQSGCIQPAERQVERVFFVWAKNGGISDPGWGQGIDPDRFPGLKYLKLLKKLYNPFWPVPKLSNFGMKEFVLPNHAIDFYIWMFLKIGLFIPKSSQGFSGVFHKINPILGGFKSIIPCLMGVFIINPIFGGFSNPPIFGFNIPMFSRCCLVLNGRHQVRRFPVRHQVRARSWSAGRTSWIARSKGGCLVGWLVGVGDWWWLVFLSFLLIVLLHVQLFPLKIIIVVVVTFQECLSCFRNCWN